MKILIVHDIGNLHGGAEVVVFQQIDILRKSGHQVKLMASDAVLPSRADYTFRCADATTVQKLRNYTYNAGAAKVMRRAIKEFTPDIIHFHTVTRLSVAGLRAAQSTPRVMTLHDYGLLYPNLGDHLPKADYCGVGDEACCAAHAGTGRYWFEKLRTSIIKREARKMGVTTVSGYVTSLAQQDGLERASTVANPAPFALQPNTSGPRKNIVLYVGRLEREKGVAELLLAFSEVLKTVPDAKLVIAGQGSQIDALKSLAQSLKLQKSVRFLGNQPRQDVAKLYRLAKVVCVPSLWPEPFSLVGLEAMSHGAVVIGSGSGGMTDWLKHRVNGITVNPDDASAFGYAISRVLKSETLRLKLQQNSKKTLDQFSNDRYFARLCSTYVAAIKNQLR